MKDQNTVVGCLEKFDWKPYTGRSFRFSNGFGEMLGEIKLVEVQSSGAEKVLVVELAWGWFTYRERGNVEAAKPGMLKSSIELERCSQLVVRSDSVSLLWKPESEILVEVSFSLRIPSRS